MARSKTNPVYNPNARRAINTDGNLKAQGNTNPKPAELARLYYADYPQLATRLPIAYPSLAKDSAQVPQPVEQPVWWQEGWFMNKFNEKIRKVIFKHLFSGAAEGFVPTGPSTYVCKADDKVSSILEVCRTTREEAMAIYHEQATLNIGNGEISRLLWFSHSTKINPLNFKNVHFMAWRPVPPSVLVGELLDLFPAMEILTIEAPADNTHITINDTKGRYTNRTDLVPGFRALLSSSLFRKTFADISVKASVPRDQRREFRQAELVIRTKEAAQSSPPRVKLLFATHVNIYSDMWLSWPAKEGESLKGLIVPHRKVVEPYMKAVSHIFPSSMLKLQVTDMETDDGARLRCQHDGVEGQPSLGEV